MKKSNLLNTAYIWFKNNLVSILIFILIVVIAILIDVYGTDISQNSVSVILALSAVGSTFFLYLTFKATKEGNTIKINERELLNLENKIVEIERRTTKPIFPEADVSLINEISQYSEIHIRYFKPINFVNYYRKLFSEIKKNSKYDEYFSLVMANPIYVHDNKECAIELDPKDPKYNDIVRFVQCLYKVEGGIWHLFRLHSDIWNLYESIHSSSLVVPLKMQLLRRLDDAVYNFLYFRKVLVENDEVGKELNDFHFFYMVHDFLIIRPYSLLTIFKEIFNAIDGIRNNYSLPII
jgi:hypothetical protein